MLRTLAWSILSLTLAACGDPEPAEDAGRAAEDARVAPMDARVAPMDARVADDAGALPSCAEVAADRGWSLCREDSGEDGARCEVVFEDGAGCAEVCAALGRPCTASYDDRPGACEPRTDLPALGCADTGHGSDYCVCGGEATDAGAPDAGPPVDAADPRPPHERILDERVGFGRFTTGGAGGPIVEVTTLADDGPGSLRAAAEATGPAWIRFRVSGEIALRSPIDVESDKTIDGRGADVTVTGFGLYVRGGRGNVVLTHFGVRDTADDLIRFTAGGRRMWVHHMDLERGRDGAFDATEGVTEVTISYTHIRNHVFTMLVGASSPSGDGETMRWTAHHNWYEACEQRMPLIRKGWAHSFNNLFNWRVSRAMEVSIAPGQLLVENNVFMPMGPIGHRVIHEGPDRGAARFIGNLERPVPGDEIEFTEHMPDAVFDASAEYPYTPETADDALIARLRAEAGRQDIPFPE
ncbi:MAG: hypothetical protein VYE22_37215 [Myxococcota bacterium]|nr:hypothetical protein [Myxococcota bacterium]